MHRVDTSTAVTSLPTPATPGTPGYFTAGNPGPGTPVAATVPGQDWFNDVQEEIAAPIEAAGITLDKTHHNQLLTAILALTQGHGQCRLGYVSATSIKLAPYDGAAIRIAGAIYQIPSAGVSIANTGLVASTRYFVYVYNNAGTLTLELSGTGHSTDTTAGNVGVEIKTGDNSRTLVGMVYTQGSTPGQFVDSVLARNVATWFKRRGLSLSGNDVSASTASTTFAALGSSANCEITCWADESIMVNTAGNGSNSTTAATFSLSLGVDGTPNQGDGSTITSPAANQAFAIFDLSTSFMTEGHHLLVPYGLVSAGTGTFFGAITASFRG